MEAKVEGVQHQIGEQREVIVRLESAGRAADHAKYLLAGLELLEAAYRDQRNEIIERLSKFLDRHRGGKGRSFDALFGGPTTVSRSESAEASQSFTGLPTPRKLGQT
jgi:hypothetical protein